MRTRSRNTTPAGTGYTGTQGAYGYDDHPRGPLRNIYGYKPPFVDYLMLKFSNLGTLTNVNAGLETITDVLSKSGDRSWNPCTHTKVEYSNPPCAYIARTEGSYPSIYPSYYPPSTMKYYDIVGERRYPCDNPLSLALPVAPLDLVALRGRAMDAMLPSFDSGFDGLNSLLELKDFRRVIAIVSNARNGSIGQWARGLTRQDAHRTLGEIHLTYGFAIAPLIRDLAALCNAADYAQRRLDAFVLQGIKGSTHHYSEIISETNTSVTSGSTIKVTTKRVTYTAQARVRYAISAGLYSRMSSMWELFGLTATGSRVWNAIPFSFVVDAFFGVDKWIQSIAKHTGGIVTDVYNTSEAMRCETIVTSHLKKFYTSNGRPVEVIYSTGITANSFGSTYKPANTVGILWSIRRYSYVRTPGVWLPRTVPLPQWKIPGIYMASLIGTIVALYRPSSEHAVAVKPHRTVRRKRLPRR